MSAREEHDERCTGLYMGTVIADTDPEGMGRIQVTIEGFIERSNWAYPLGTSGGGSKRRGLYAVPPNGSMVGIFFNQGDIDHPYYMTGHWGNNVDGAADDNVSPGTELPERVRDVPNDEKPKLVVFETERWAVIYDDRQEERDDDGAPLPDDGSGRNSLLIVSKDDPNTAIELDGARRGITIRSTVGIFIRSNGLIDIDGTKVQIAGRMVVKNGKPIT